MAVSTSAEAQVSDRELHLTRVLDAPRALVFKAWSEPDRVAQWWGPQGFTTIFCKMDFRPGGAWRVGMRSPEGTDHWKQGVYREIAPPERLVFTYAWEDKQGRPGHETLVTVTFTDHGGKTRLSLHQAMFETVTSRDAHQGGWTSCLQRFADYLAHTGT